MVGTNVYLSDIFEDGLVANTDGATSCRVSIDNIYLIGLDYKYTPNKITKQINLKNIFQIEWRLINGLMKVLDTWDDLKFHQSLKIL